MNPDPGYTGPPESKRRKRPRFWRVLVLLVVFVLATGAALAQQTVADTFGVSDWRGVAWISAARDVALARIGESPALEPQPFEGEIIVCDEVTPSQRRAFEDGVAMMRATEKGRELHELLQSEGVCIGIVDLPYNSAFAMARWSPTNGWAGSEIRIDKGFVTFMYPDLLAAILVHEGVHIQRAIEGTACYYAQSCTDLPNGVHLDEEVVAHSAEAEFWIELYGRDGKDRAFAQDHSQNRLKSVYLQGPEPFWEYVREMRSNAREGEGI